MVVSARGLLIFSFVLAAWPAAAQMFNPGYGSYGAPMSNFISSSYLVQRVANGAVKSGRSSKAAATRKAPAAETEDLEEALGFEPDGDPIAPRKLAQGYPSAARAQTEKVFNQVLEGYRRIEEKTGLEPNDLAGAVAAFLVGNFTVLQDRPVPDDYFMPLRNQMHAALAGTRELQRAADAEKQEMYEHFAIIGTYMALLQSGLKEKPDADLANRTRDAARQYLKQFTQVDPKRLELTAKGLVIH